ncbi:tyrosine aminotransferase [Condylostylus longicornis]|uniref:tyrosine aminotransferase n=1 Tax=Condylostylus longicornis TaxID=2530218 RepID=UPI00244E3C96|nr:tyrosine aminotransferase [Condylostylus longicornis]
MPTKGIKSSKIPSAIGKTTDNKNREQFQQKSSQLVTDDDNEITPTIHMNGAIKKHGKSQRTQWNVQATEYAKKTKNHIRHVVQELKLEPNPDKPMIPLSIGDPTTFGNLQASDETINAVKKAMENSKANGYGHCAGFEEARAAVAKYCEHQGKVTAEDVILCSGCSSSLDLCITALAEKGQNILMPRPGFCLYKTLAEGISVEVRLYDLLPEHQWEADINQLESLIDDKTAAIIVNNPSNPCGSVFSKKNLQAIIKVAERNFVPIIADEIYEHFVFPGSEHIAVSTLSQNVPVLSCGGLTKRFLVPGWRLGWIVIHDRHDILKDATRGLKNLTGRILGPNTLIQTALPDILEKTTQKFFDDTISVIYKNAFLAFEMLNKVPGLKPIMPAGAMYMMIGIEIDKFPEFPDDLEFVQRLVGEQSVFCLPGACFDYPNYMRIVLTVPGEMIKEAADRIAEFCEKHYESDSNIIENNSLELAKC